jgi:hypothetical protein
MGVHGLIIHVHSELLADLVNVNNIFWRLLSTVQNLHFYHVEDDSDLERIKAQWAQRGASPEMTVQKTNSARRGAIE